VPRKGVRICKVEPGSLAENAGLEPRDEILAVNGQDVADELALKFYLAEGLVALDVRKADGREVRVKADMEEGQGLGVQTEDFRTRTCNNDCLFCFVKQLPPGVRRLLKVKDDDYRLSFLHGNYITLTNLSESDLDRIIEHSLSPLYVSVHATDPELRTRIMGRRKVDDLAGKMRKLIAGGIRIHAQIVLMPGLNDGEMLTRTVSDLYSYYPGVDSVAVVPLGLSDHGVVREQIEPVTPSFCRDIVRQAAPWQRRFRLETGRGFVYLADEFFIQGGMPIPGSSYYDDFAQIEDGVGMVRNFLRDFTAHLGRRHQPGAHLRGTLATGRLFYPFLQKCIVRLNQKLGSHLDVAEVENRFMGKNITVAGLLAGCDFAQSLAGRRLGDFVVIPDETLSRGERIFLDDMSLSDLEGLLGKPVFTSGRSMRDFFRLLGNM
jgi:putative radical SAM enzyme (TIGR03279 family)